MTIDELNIIQQAEDIKNILKTEHGRRFLWRLLSYCGVYRDVEGDPIDMQKQLGRRQVGLYLMGILSDIDDEQVFNMMREAKNKDKEDNNVRERERAIIERNNDEDRGARSHTYDGNTLNDYI